MKCDFCGREIPPGTGKIVVMPDGSFLTFCSRKCEKNYLELKRSPQKARWTRGYHREKEIRISGVEKKVKKKIEKEKKGKKLSKKERRELRKQKKLEKKKAKLEKKSKKTEERKPKEKEGTEGGSK